MSRLKYFIGSLISLPILPVMYFQAKKIRKKIPKLTVPNDMEGNEGNGDKAIHLLIIGESTMAGVGAKENKSGFAGHLARYLSAAIDQVVQWKVIAKSGYTAKMVRDKLITKDLVVNPPEVIVIGLGGNDSFTLNSPKKWKQHTLDLIKILKSKFPKAPIVFIGMPPIKDFPVFTKSMKFVLGNLAEIFGEEMKAIAANANGVYYMEEKISLQKWLKQENKNGPTSLSNHDFFSDGVHPSELTYRIWARDTSDFILKKIFPSKA